MDGRFVIFVIRMIALVQTAMDGRFVISAITDDRIGALSHCTRGAISSPCPHGGDQ